MISSRRLDSHSLPDVDDRRGPRPSRTVGLVGEGGPGRGWSGAGGLLSPDDHWGSRRVSTISLQIMINLRFSL